MGPTEDNEDKRTEKNGGVAAALEGFIHKQMNILKTTDLDGGYFKCIIERTMGHAEIGKPRSATITRSININT